MLPRINGEFRVGSDPSLKFSQAGKPFGNFRAVASARKEVNGEWTTTDEIWVTVTVFGKTAEMVADHVTKGALVLIEGRVSEESWEKDGETRKSVKVIADSVGLIPKVQSNTQSQPQQQQADPWASAPSSTEPPF